MKWHEVETRENQTKPEETKGTQFEGLAVTLDVVETGGNRSKPAETTYREFQ
jgi:hypothetical protein